MNIHLPSSKLQSNVALQLDDCRRLFLQQALSNTIASLELKDINAALDDFAPASELKTLASQGIRGEFVFAVPPILRANPRLLGYYRLLLGYSQKEFYSKSGLGRFASMENAGRLTPKVSKELKSLCRAFCHQTSVLLKTVGLARLSMELLDDLTLLTLGPQIRGGINTQIGKDANRSVFELVEKLLSHCAIKRSTSCLSLKNASGKEVTIAFAADPDICVQEKLSSREKRNILAIEIKGGADQSNVWNRLGEAEKSHQSAKQLGFVEFWTIYNVAKLDLSKAHEKSPTTNRFYSLQELLDSSTISHADFRDRLASMVGVPIRKPAKGKKK